jgi:hypothetical protein
MFESRCFLLFHVFSFEFGGGHTPLPLSCYTTLLATAATEF